MEFIDVDIGGKEQEGEVCKILSDRTGEQPKVFAIQRKDGSASIHRFFEEEETNNNQRQIKHPTKISFLKEPSINICFISCESPEETNSKKQQPSLKSSDLSCSSSSSSSSPSSSPANSQKAAFVLVINNKGVRAFSTPSLQETCVSIRGLDELLINNNNENSPIMAASFRDVIAIISGNQLGIFKAKMISNNNMNNQVSIEKDRIISIPGFCSYLSVSELAVWIAFGTKLQTIVIQQPQNTNDIESVQTTDFHEPIIKLAALCCLCVVGTEKGSIFLAALRCCCVSGSSLLNVAKINLVEPISVFDAFQSSLVIATQNKHGLVFSCCREARSCLLKMTETPQPPPPQQQEDTDTDKLQFPKITVDPQIATLSERRFIDIAILSSRSLALLCENNTAQILRW